MSETIPRGQETGQQAHPQYAEIPAAVDAGVPGGRRRGGRVAAGLVLAVAAGVLAAWAAGAFSAAGPPVAGQVAAATVQVLRENLSAATPVAATLGYAGSYTVTGQGGTLTGLPKPGQVICQGQVLYTTDLTSPVVLLYGSVPDWRALSEGVTGQDVAQLNHDLAALGDASSSDIAAAGWNYYSAATAYGVQQLEEHAGASAPSGSLSLGQVVFEPAALRVAQVTGSLGGRASGPVLAATSAEHVVTIALDTSQEAEVKAGDAISVTLPDGTVTPGVVSAVGTVAATSPSQSGGTTTTIPVTVTLTNPAAAGSLDQAPVTVYITTATARNVLAVPVTALLARSPAGYDVEVAGPNGTRRYVPVTPGIFDDTTGLVQVTGDLTPGQRVVVASS